MTDRIDEMSTASSRQEPSMDEILASIRRIIESGDERDGASGDALLSISPDTHEAANRISDGLPSSSLVSPVPPFDIHYLPTSLGEEPAVARQGPDVASFDEDRAAVELHPASAEEARSEIGELEPEPAPSAAPELPQGEAPSAQAAPVGDVSDDAWWDAAVADAGRVEAETQVSREDERQPATAAELPSPHNENAVSRDGTATLRSDWSNAAAQDVSQASVDGDFDRAPTQTPAEAPFVPAVSPPQFAAPEAARPMAVAVETRRTEMPEARAEMPESVIAGASALLSMQAGDQVAAAFDDLTRAIREGHMRSMEGMAREIMRPMLQEWLDDNLPRIVERLVRDEIERIARGPRR